MWSLDANCDRCKHKSECKDRLSIIPKLSKLSADLNAKPDTIGDGKLIVVCSDFKPK